MSRPKVKNWRGRWLKRSADNPHFARSREYNKKRAEKEQKRRDVEKAMKNATLKGYFE